MKTAKMIAAMLAASVMASPALALATPAQKKLSAELVEAQTKLAQEMVDMVFSYAEPGFQEHKTSEYLTGILEKNGFTVVRGAAGIPTAFTATWSNGPGPKIALGSDIDGLLGLSQYPGVVQMKPMVEGGPGHGEGHNSGNAVNVVKLNGRPVPPKVVTAVLGFIHLYSISVLVLTFVLLATGLDFLTAFTAVIASINNTGPGLGLIGPASNFGVLSDFQTWVCTFAMLLGRLELFTVFVLFTPNFWRD